MDKGPIFVGGIDRTGKTLLCQMLACHPNLAFTRRTYMWTRFYRRYGDLAREENLERCLAAMLAHKPMQVLRPDPVRIRAEFRQGPPTYARLFGLFHQHYAESVGKPRWGDQLGMVEQFAVDIFAAMPTASMIQMIRHPKERFEAALEGRTWCKGKVGWSMARWLASTRLAEDNLRKFPDRYMVLHYEALVQNPESVLREICEFIGEEYAPEMMKAFSTPAFNSSTGGTDASELSNVTVQTQKDKAPIHISNTENAFIQRIAREELATFGYPLDPPELTVPERLIYVMFDFPINYIGMLTWKQSEGRAVP